MRVPKRRGEEWRNMSRVVDHHVTKKKLEQMKRNITSSLEERPEAAAEVQRMRELGDLSENAGYQAAKSHLRRLNNGILVLEEKIKRAIVIEEGPNEDGMIRIGSTVLLFVNKGQQEFKIVGGQETDPTKGLISHSSPLGLKLLGHKAGDEISLEVKGTGEVVYQILEVK